MMRQIIYPFLPLHTPLYAGLIMGSLSISGSIPSLIPPLRHSAWFLQLANGLCEFTSQISAQALSLFNIARTKRKQKHFGNRVVHDLNAHGILQTRPEVSSSTPVQTNHHFQGLQSSFQSSIPVGENFYCAY